MADVVLFSFRLRFSEAAKPEKSGRLALLKPEPSASAAYEPGPTAEGVCAPSKADTRLERVVIVIIELFQVQPRPQLSSGLQNEVWGSQPQVRPLK